MSSATPVQFILGTHRVGDSTQDPLATIDSEKDVKELFDAFQGRGYKHVDTAANYPPNAPGSSEPRLGRAGVASHFAVHSKIRDGPPGSHEPSKIYASIDRSLEALQTPSLDTIFLHVPDRQTPFEDTIGAINEAIQQGKAKSFGISNYTPAEVKQIVEICEKNNWVKPRVYEGHYNAVTRGGEKELFPLLREHNMAFWAYSPAAGGFFSGNANSAQWSEDNGVGKLYSSMYASPAVQAALTTVKNAAEKHGISSHEAVVRWAAFHSALDGEYGDGVVFGVSKTAQVHKTLDGLEAGPLPDDLAEAIGAIYATFDGTEPPYHL